MKLEEIEASWEEDAQIDKTDLFSESLKIPQLHHKYHKMLSRERMLLHKVDDKLEITIALRHDFYSGKIDDDTLAERGWTDEFKAFSVKVMKSDMDRYLDSDKVIHAERLKKLYQKEKVDLIFSILENIKWRNQSIKNAIEWQKFISGG